MKELKDYAHLYLGCKAIITNQDGEDTRFTLNTYNLNYYRDYMANLKLILRPLSDMPHDLHSEMEATMDMIEFKGYKLRVDSGETFAWLLKHGYDIFGLKESGLAVYE